jgi:hypothetical protein
VAGGGEPTRRSGGERATSTVESKRAGAINPLTSDDPMTEP